MTSERVRRAKRKYSMFEGEPLLLEETASEDDLDYVPYKYKKVPVNFGFELEQNPLDIGVTGDLMMNREPYNAFGLTWDYDYSGPYEAQLPAGTRGSMRYPGREVHQFFRMVKAADGEWRWKGEFEENGCGCHIHFSARTEIEHPYRLKENPYEAWTVLYNTLIETVPFLKPLFAWGHNTIFSHRKSVGNWASDKRKRLSVSSIRNSIDNPTGFSENKHDSVALHPASGEPEERDGLGGLFSTRGQGRVTPQTGVAAKPITVEMRLNEAHPSATYLSGILLNRIVRKCIERGYTSPKLNVDNTVEIDGEQVDRRELYFHLTRFGKKSYEWISRDTYHSLYDIYNRIKNINFKEGRGIPLLDEHYDTYMDLFKAILRKYCPTYPPLARMAMFYYDEGDPWVGNNQRRFWNIFAPLEEFLGWDGDGI